VEVAAIDIWNPVVFRKALIDEGIVRPHQVEDVAVFAHDAAKKQLGLALK